MIVPEANVITPHPAPPNFPAEPNLTRSMRPGRWANPKPKAPLEIRDTQNNDSDLDSLRLLRKNASYCKGPIQIFQLLLDLSMEPVSPNLKMSADRPAHHSSVSRSWTFVSEPPEIDPLC